MELKKLTDAVIELFEIKKIEQLGDALMKYVLTDNIEKYEKFESLVGDLEIDWLQKIYQYHQADRKSMMQDFTPKSLGTLMARLCGKADMIVDMCGGSGALTIQRWAESKDTRFTIYELDKTVLPYLLFNLAVRNIESFVFNSDVLEGETYKKFAVVKGEKYGKVEEIKE